MPHVAFDHYYRYEELAALLHEFARAHPTLVQVDSIGRSHEGRDILIATVTDFATGRPEDRPGFWCDGNIHATEVSATTAVLCILQQLVEGDIQLLRERVFYLVPRLGPDGAEMFLGESGRSVRSGTRNYPYAEPDPYGLERRDLDGDGRILNMRIPDPNGPWKISDIEPRLMQRRDPGETGGQYYRMVPEGLFHHWDGLTMRSQREPAGLDFNRNFPSAWRLECEQPGAGPFPASEPEIRAAVQAIVDRPNICGAITFHTYSGVLLRPPARFPDTDLPAEDLWTYQKLGEIGQEMTGYPAISNFHEFRYHPKAVITGTFDDWMLEHRGVHAWTVEIWAPPRQAGITDYKYIEWFRDHPFADDVQMLKWADENLDGQGYIDWQPFDHPQLGSVEIGGWDAQLAFRNPPLKFLQREVEPLAKWAIWHAGTGPRLSERALVLEPFGEASRIRFAVQNSGWLPTNVTRLGADRKLCRGVIGSIRRQGDPASSYGNPEPDWLVSGKLDVELGQLMGYSHVPAGGWAWRTDATEDVAIFEWVVRPGVYEIEARHDRAGRVRTVVTVA